MFEKIIVALCLIQAMECSQYGERDCQASGRLFRSCSELKQNKPCSESGYYSIVDGDTIRPVYCQLEEEIDCGSVSDGWRQVAYLNMSEDGSSCPPDFQVYDENGIKACGRPRTRIGSCSSIKFPTDGVYDEVCGRVVGYQFGFSGGINPVKHPKSIDKVYIDGVSITSGSPRTHIWSFITAHNEIEDTHNDNRHMCPCSEDIYPRINELPEFIGEDWSCESGASTFPTKKELYTDDPLWDGKQCSAAEPCCSTKGQPFFYKVLAEQSSEDIELRVCDNNGNHPTRNDRPVDHPVALYELYVR